MVIPFHFSRLPKIYFRSDIADLPYIIRHYGDKIVLVTGKSSFIRSTRAANLFQDFATLGISYQMVTVDGEPSVELIDEAVKRIKNEKVDLVVAVGGGSVLDAGKALSAMIYKDESVIEYLEGVGTKDHPGTKLPFIAVPTTSGTGSEATKNAVISKIGNNGFKKSLRHDNFVPDLAFIDPGLTLECPKNITAASGMDCFTQLVESYLSDKASPFTDALAMEGLKIIKNSLLKCYNTGSDIEARTGMSFAALVSGICLANAGLGVVHGFASSIGGMYEIPHGLICGTLMAQANSINVKKLKKSSGNSYALGKYALLGELFLDEKGKTNTYYIDGFTNYLHGLTDEMNLPGLGEYGVATKDIDMICSATENKNNPVKLNITEMSEIISNRLY